MLFMSFTLHVQLHLTNNLCLIASFDNLHKKYLYFKLYVPNRQF